MEEDIKKLSREELYLRIDSLRGDKWIYSEEYKELQRRLDTFSLKRLEEEGYDIPNDMRIDSDIHLKKLKKK